MFPVTPIQEDWVSSVRDAPGEAKVTGHLPVVLHITGQHFTHEDVEAVVDGLVARHEVLRASVRHSGETFFHYIDDRPPPSPVELIDAVPSEVLVARAMEATGTPIDLSAAPLWRGWLSRIGNRHWVLAMAIAHAIWDEGSTVALTRDIARALAARATGEPPPPAPQLSTFIRGQRARLTDDARAYWETAFRDADPFSFPGTERPTASGHMTAVKLDPIPGPLVAELVKLGGASAASTVTALVLASLAPWLPDVAALGRTWTGRAADADEDTLGLLVDVLPLVVRTGGRDSFVSLVRSVHAAAKDAHVHRAPGPVICRALALARPPWRLNVNYVPRTPEVAHLETRGTIVTVREQPVRAPAPDLNPPVGPWSCSAPGLTVNLCHGNELGGEVWVRPELHAMRPHLHARLLSTARTILAHPGRAIRKLDE